MFDNKAELAEKILTQREGLGVEGFISETYTLTADPRLISSAIPLSERSYLAFILLVQILKSRSKTTSPFAKSEEGGQKPSLATTGEERARVTKGATIGVQDYYATLGVDRTADKTEMRKAYRVLMNEFHPDKLMARGVSLSPEQQQELFLWNKDVTLAWEVLQNPDSKADYDTLVASPGVETYTPSPPSFLSEAAKSVVGKAAGEITKKVVGGVAKKVAGQIATKAGQAVAVAGAEAVGVAATGPAAPITFVVIEVGKKILGFFKNVISLIGRFFKSEDSKELRWAGSVGTLVGGILLLNAGVIFGLPLVVLGGLATLGMLAAAGAGAQIAGFGASILSGLTAVVIPAIGIPILVALVSVPLIVALILFIINSGAYLVPPREFGFLEENPYIRVEKTVEVVSIAPPPGRCDDRGPDPNTGEPDSTVDCENNARPITVQYTITVTALRGSLTNISFDHECEVITDNGVSSCPAPIPSPAPAVISPLTPYVYTFTQSPYSGSNYQDSLVINTFTVTADTDEALGTSATGAASVTIGDPPTACFDIQDFPPTALTAELVAIGDLTRASIYMARLCQAGDIILKYGGDNGSVGGDVLAGPNIITIYRAGVAYGPTSTLYTLAHETGHIFARRLGGVYSNYVSVLNNNFICSYPFTNSNSESFAEMIGLYVANSPGHAPINLFSCFGADFQGYYPEHWQFARNNIFLEDLTW